MRYGNVINRKDILMGKHVQISPKRTKNTLKRSLTVAAAVGLMLTTSGSAFAATPQEAKNTSFEQVATPELNKATTPTSLAPAVTASSTVKLNFERPVVKAVAAPVKPKVKVEESAPVVKQAEPAKAAVAVATPAKAAGATPAPAPAPAVPANPVAPVGPVAGSSKGAAIAAAAKAQLGVEQDCTMLVTNSLKAVGINFHGWPADYMSLGTVVSAAEAQPGDILVYANGGAGLPHVAVYIGNGQAVHGGWNGHTTAIFSANVGSGPTYIRVR